MTGPDFLLEIVSWLSREADPRLGVMLFNIQHDIQSDDIHLLARSLWRLQDIFEDSINFLRCANALGKKKEGFTFYCGPDSAPTSQFSLLDLERL
jgi:hypothetical protein